MSLSKNAWGQFFSKASIYIINIKIGKKDKKSLKTL